MTWLRSRLSASRGHESWHLAFSHDREAFVEFGWGWTILGGYIWKKLQRKFCCKRKQAEKCVCLVEILETLSGNIVSVLGIQEAAVLF